MPPTVGYQCGFCGEWFLLRSRYVDHRHPEFIAYSAALREKAEQNYLRRQVEIGRLTLDGEWVRDWRPSIIG